MIFKLPEFIAKSLASPASVRIYHIVTGIGLDSQVLQEAIRLSDDKYCSDGAMIKETADCKTTFEIQDEQAEWLKKESEPAEQVPAI